MSATKTPEKSTPARKKGNGKPSEQTLKRKAKRLVTLRDAGKEAYTEADKVLEELLKAGCKPGDTIELAGGAAVEIIDNFVNRTGEPVNKAWKPCGINRYDVKVTHAKRP